MWTFPLPALHQRPEDIAPNLDFELSEASRVLGIAVTMNKEARETFLRFARGWEWPGNFRDFNAAVTRMATLAHGGRITEAEVEEELAAKPPDARGRHRRVEDLLVEATVASELVERMAAILAARQAPHGASR